MPFEGEGCSTLIIHSVSNERAVERILRLCIDGRHYLHEVQPLLRRLPARIEQLDLGFIHEELWKCEMRGWMRFEVERS